MDRRRFGAAVGGSLVAGCVAAPRNEPAGAATPTTTPPPDHQTTVTLAAQDAVPTDLDVAIAVELHETAVTDDTPARLRVTTTNQGPPRGISISHGGCRRFDRWDGGSDHPRGLWLHEPGAAGRYPRRSDRWTWELSEAVAGVPDGGCTWGRYERGKSVSNAYEVWDDPSVAGHLVPGTYRFEQPVGVVPGDADGGDVQPLAEYTWGSALDVSRPGPRRTARTTAPAGRLMAASDQGRDVYRASDRVEQAAWLERLDEAAAALDLDDEVRTTAADLYLSAVPEDDRSKPARLAASLYAAALIAGDGRPQTEVADAVGVSRLVVQDRWKDVLRSAGFRPPSW